MGFGVDIVSRGEMRRTLVTDPRGRSHVDLRGGLGIPYRADGVFPAHSGLGDGDQFEIVADRYLPDALAAQSAVSRGQAIRNARSPA